MMNVLIGGFAVLSLLVQAQSARTLAETPASAGQMVTFVPAWPPKAQELTDRARLRLNALRPQPERGPCNMPVIRANSDIDPKMVVPIEQGKNQAKIRAVEPTICWEKDNEPKR